MAKTKKTKKVKAVKKSVLHKPVSNRISLLVIILALLIFALTAMSLS